jgi:hypothetical protein
LNCESSNTAAREKQAGLGRTPTGAGAAFALASLALADAIGEFHFTERELVLLHCVRRLTFGRGRTTLYLRRLDFFAPLGISRGNASGILRALEGKRVLEERPAAWWGFIVPPSLWDADPKRGVARVLEEQFQLGLVSGDLTELARDANRELFVESFADPAGTGWAATFSPTRGAGETSRVVRPVRSDPRPDVAGESEGGVASRESAGSAGQHGEPRPGLPQGPGALMPPETQAAVEKLAAAVYSQAVPIRDRSRSRIGTDSGGPESGPSSKAMPARVLRAGPESGPGSPFKAVRVSAGTELLTAETLKGAPLSAAQVELRRGVAGIVGAAAWTNWGGAWTNAIKRDAARVGRVVAEYHAERRAGRLIPNPGGWMWDLFKRWQ